MASGLQIMQGHLAGRPGLGMGAWDDLITRGWHPQQIAALGPHTGYKIGGWAQQQMGLYPNAASNIGMSGLYNLGAAQKWVNKGFSPEQIAAAGGSLAGTPRGLETGETGWKAGFTSEARDWLISHYKQQEVEEETAEEEMWAERIANIPTAAELMANMPQPKIRAGKDYATTGRAAQGMRIKKGTKFAEGGKRGTKGYFGRGAKFTGDTTPTMNIAGGGGGSATQASNTLNTA